VVRFSFTQAMAPSPWEADAILRRDVLVVQYNDIMLLTDFEDGDYMMEPM
jgi:hypothetical protein